MNKGERIRKIDRANISLENINTLLHTIVSNIWLYLFLFRYLRSYEKKKNLKYTGSRSFKNITVEIYRQFNYSRYYSERMKREIEWKLKLRLKVGLKAIVNIEDRSNRENWRWKI